MDLNWETVFIKTSFYEQDPKRPHEEMMRASVPGGWIYKNICRDKEGKPQVSLVFVPKGENGKH